MGKDVNQLTLAISKGRIFEETLPILSSLRIEPLENPKDSRKLVIGTKNPGVQIMMVRASDVPTYVRHGAADFGVAGRDVLVEQGAEGLYQPVDLGIAKCRMAVATRENYDYEEIVKKGARIMVATKYAKIARAHFAGKGVHADIIKLYGSMELAPLAGLSDVIVDLVSTGATLKANNLREVEDIMPISARLVVNRTALTTKGGLLRPILKQVESITGSV